MLLRATLLSAALLGHVKASATPGSTQPGFSSFSPCTENPALECGYVIVPKDYKNPTVGIANISVARRPATTTPKIGTVFFNFGGPGVPGAALFVSTFADYVADRIGPQWDIASFDPRGIGASTPKVHCFASKEAQLGLYKNTVFEQGYTLPNMTHSANSMNKPALVQQEREHISVFKKLSQSCEENMDVNDLRFMGTTTVARDVAFMTEVLDGPGAHINFYGYSYGTNLGSQILNMFPNRIGFFTLDGIVDPVAVSHEVSSMWPLYFQQDSEKTYLELLKGCSQVGPTRCHLSRCTGEEPAKINARIEAFVQQLVRNPLQVGGADPGYLSAGAIRNLFVNALYSPLSWPVFSNDLADAMAGNGTALLATLRAGVSGQADGDATRFAVVCADSPRNPRLTPSDYADQLLKAFHLTRFAGGLIFTDPDGGCEFWPVQPSERFTGPFNISRPTRPVLIISNTADPITPLSNGLDAHARLRGRSVMVIQDGPGHCSLALASECTRNNTLAYWAGKNPTNGTVCSVDETPWPATDAPEISRRQQPSSLHYGWL